MNDQTVKADAGKPRLSLTPVQIVYDIAEVREYGCEKYGDPNNWKRVEFERYVDAMLRHTLAFVRDPFGVDEESGIEHYKHAECNWSFISEMMQERRSNADKAKDNQRKIFEAVFNEKFRDFVKLMISDGTKPAMRGCV